MGKLWGRQARWYFDFLIQQTFIFHWQMSCKKQSKAKLDRSPCNEPASRENSSVPEPISCTCPTKKLIVEEGAQNILKAETNPRLPLSLCCGSKFSQPCYPDLAFHLVVVSLWNRRGKRDLPFLAQEGLQLTSPASCIWFLWHYAKGT